MSDIFDKINSQYKQTVGETHPGTSESTRRQRETGADYGVNLRQGPVSTRDRMDHIEELLTAINERLEKQDDTLRQMKEVLVRHSNRLGDLEKRLGQFEENKGTVASRIENIEEKYKSLNERSMLMNERFKVNESMIQETKARLETVVRNFNRFL